jgi:hypothetical protein
MKRLLLAALALSALAAPASAQYYGPYSPAPRWYEPAPRYQPQPDYDRPRSDHYERRRSYDEGPPRGVWRRPARQAGNVCVTSRGSCEYPQYFRLQTPCRCDIPGFGPKRGAILQ